MTTPRTPSGLAVKGRKLWRDLLAVIDLDPAQLILLEEACRIADRLDKLDALLSGELEHWVDLRDIKGREDAVEIVMNSALSEARQQANVLKQIVAALRIPDEATGQKPQRRGARGAYQTAKPSGNVSSLERARAARSS